MVNYVLALLTSMYICFLKIQSLCWEIADFREHKQGGGHSRLVNVQIVAKVSFINLKYGMFGNFFSLETAWVPVCVNLHWHVMNRVEEKGRLGVFKWTYVTCQSNNYYNDTFHN